MSVSSAVNNNTSAAATRGFSREEIQWPCCITFPIAQPDPITTCQRTCCHPEWYSWEPSGYRKDLGSKGALPPFPRSFASTLRMTHLLHIKILRLRMMHDDGVGALFRHEHEIFADADADLLGAQ